MQLVGSAILTPLLPVVICLNAFGYKTMPITTSNPFYKKETSFSGKGPEGVLYKYLLVEQSKRVLK